MYLFLSAGVEEEDEGEEGQEAVEEGSVAERDDVTVGTLRRSIRTLPVPTPLTGTFSR